MSNRLNLGFTLLELLVVISIIGILMAIGVSAYTTAQKKSRDARRRGDIKAIQNAFEQYYAQNGSYADDCTTMATDFMMGGNLPSDPQTGVSYSATCDSDATAGTYCVCAQLENPDTGNATSGGPAATCTFGAGSYYCLNNLQ